MTEKKTQGRHLSQLVDPDQLDLQPLKSLDPDETGDTDELLQGMSKTAFSGRSLGEALNILEIMVEDPECHVVATFSGAMTVAKMGTIICKMVDKGWVDTIISTGALMAHGFIESLDLRHYKYEPEKHDDETLFSGGLNRVYDTLEPELNFIQAEKVMDDVLEDIKAEEFMSSYSLCQAIGRYLSQHYQGKGILKSAYEKGVPVYIPAFTDSELALDVATNILKRLPQVAQGSFDPRLLPFQFNPFLDLYHFTHRATQAKKLAIFTIGGGVPRNWAQQLGPFVEMAREQLGEKSWNVKRFQYGIRICPEPDHWGGLSGCTYQEGISWGKFVPVSQGGRYAEIYSDATIVWPILIKGLQERLNKKRAG